MIVIHQALQHLVVGGNVLSYGQTGIKPYPLNRFVVERDGNGNVTEIITKERIDSDLIPNYTPSTKQDVVDGEDTDRS